MIYAETERLRLRAMEERDMARVAELIGDWDVAKWLTRVPYPYSIDDARWWLDRVGPGYVSGEPEFFVIADGTDDSVMGGVGLHPRNVPEPEEGELELGYWLGKPYWGRGIMSEAVRAILPLGFARAGLKKISVFTDIDNTSSQNVLRKSGFRFLGNGPRIELDCLRGSETVTRWEMLRGEFETRQVCF